jgi:hypothetical protein
MELLLKAGSKWGFHSEIAGIHDLLPVHHAVFPGHSSDEPVLQVTKYQCIILRFVLDGKGLRPSTDTLL